jgi:tetratricopeptide (TPR) repeat protein
MRWRAHVFWTGWALLAAALLRLPLAPGSLARSTPAADQPAPEPPPGQRVLSGDDAQRVEGLEKKIPALWQAGKDAEARAAAREVLAIRRRVQGAGHWQTEDARRQVRRLEQIATLAAGARAELARAAGQMAEAERLDAQVKYAAAEPLYRKALAIRRQLLGEDHPDTALGYHNLASNLRAQGRYAQALPLFQKALDLRRKLLGEDHPDTALSYNDLAYNLLAQGRATEAQPLFQKALDLYRKLLGEDHPRTAIVYHNLAGSLLARGRYAEAQPLFEKALDLCRKRLGENHPDTATSYNNLAGSLESQGRNAEAQPLFQKALDLRRQLLGEDHPHTAQSYNNLAANLNDQGRHAEAQPLFQKALDLSRKRLGEDHPVTAKSYGNLAGSLEAQGRYAEAHPLHQKALDLHLKLLRENHPDTATSYNNLAYNLQAQGRHAEAHPLYQKALDLRLKLLSADHPLMARSYNNLAYNLQAQGRYAQAHPLYQKALDLHRQLLGEDHPDTALSYNNLAYNLQAQGRYAEAQPLFQKALDLRRKLLGEDHPRTATSYDNLAYILHAQGVYEQAEQHLQAASRSFTRARRLASFSGLERAHAQGLRFSPLPLLAALLARRGQPEEAWARLEEDLARGLLDDLSARRLRPLTPAEVQREQALLGNLHRLEEQMNALLTRSARMEAGMDRSLAGSGGVGPWAGHPGVAAAGAVLRSTCSLGWHPWRPMRDKLAALQDQHLTSQAEFSAFEQALVRKYGVAAGQTFAPGRIQARVPPAAALVAWVDVPARPRAADPDGEHWACVVRHRGAPVWVRLPGSGPDRAWTEADDLLPKQVREGLVQPPAEGGPPWRDGAARLYGQRLAPLAECLAATPDLPAVRHLIILPSRALAGVPVEALVAARPEGRPGYAVSYAPSGTMFAWLQEQRLQADAPDGPAGPGRLLALGDPVFTRPGPPAAPSPEPPDHGVLLTVVQPGANAAQGGVQAGDVLLSYAGTKLPGPADLPPALAKVGGGKWPDAQRGGGGIAVTVWRAGRTLDLTVRPGDLGVIASKKSAAEAVRESREADALLERTRGQPFTPLPGTRREVETIARLFPQPEVLLGSQANEQELERRAASDRLRAFRYLHFATHGVLDDQVALRSALILSQDHLADPLAQALAGQEVYNGRVTAEQIRRTWKLDADLVTLSACQTGLGQFRGGEGYVGFSQALFLAGARSLVLSLWKVDDDATALLMTRFYQNLLGRRPGLQQPLPKAAALAEAKDWLRGLTKSEAARLRPRGEVEPVEEILPDPAGGRPYEHPYYWAAFVLIGDPGDLPPETANQPSSTRWIIPSVIGACVLAGALVMAVVARVRRRKPV